MSGVGFWDGPMYVSHSDQSDCNASTKNQSNLLLSTSELKLGTDIIVDIG